MMVPERLVLVRGLHPEEASGLHCPDRGWRCGRALTAQPQAVCSDCPDRGHPRVPRRLMHPKRKTIGIRVPECAIIKALLSELDSPIMSSTLLLPGEELPMTDPYDIRTTLEYHIDLVIDGGYRGMEATTVISLMEDTPQILRVGKGDPTPFQAG